MKIGGFDTHPAADVLELIQGEEFDKLVADIRANGQREAIVLFVRGKKQLILDGRNRYRAILKLGVKPQFTVFEGDELAAIAFVKSKNLHRRHMTASQRAYAAAQFAELEQGQRKTGKFADVPTQKQAASQLSVSERSVRSGRVVLAKASPVVKKAVQQGRMAIDAAASLALFSPTKQRELMKQLDGAKEIKTGHVRAVLRQEQKRSVAARIDAERTPLPIGPFRVVLSDPAWKYDNSDGHVGSRGHTSYPTMDTDSICELHARELPPMMHEDSILWLCTTNWHLVNGHATRVVLAAGYEPITPLTWKKNKLGMGSWLRNQTEHVILAVRGKPTMVNTTISTWFEADVREHSRKPERLYEIIEQTCPGAKLEMFSRAPREGWARWGAEQNKYAEAV